MKFALPTCVAALLLQLATPTHVRAELVSWSYSWSNSPGVIDADSPGTGYITLTNESLHQVAGNTNIVATNLRTFSTAPPDTPDVFTNKGYNLSLYILDQASGQSGTLSFTGVLNGTVTGTNSNLQNTFTGPITQTLILGGNLYTVTIGPYSPPGPPGSVNSGTISSYASVTVQAIGTPEPSTWVLSLGGLLGFTVVAGRRWRKQRLAVC